jgi:hypothetical protein
MTTITPFVKRALRHRAVLVAALAAMLFIGIAIGRSSHREVIEIDQAAIDFRIGEIERGRGTPLTAAERDQAASAYIDEHVLARVARRRGFEDDDRIRGILYQRMLQVLASDAPDPSEADLRAYYARNQSRYASSESMTAERWSVVDGVRARQAVLERVTPTELALAFGDRTAHAVARAAIGEAVSLDRGAAAMESLVVVARFPPGAPPPFESIRLQVRFDWRVEHDEALLKNRVAELRDQYVVRVVPARDGRALRIDPTTALRAE